TQQIIWILYYKRYFTPNGDGINDTWGIDYSKFEPDLKVVIYDRYGKAITSLNSNNPEWDGNFNGQLLFATDYWFVVYRQDGRIHKGHFALKR
ncbi:MAG: T9SS type B sorting domain-containing protein, partial [Flavobacterium sp.]